MRVGSLFSGIGGLDLGLERAGMEIAWQVESDPFCQDVLQRHWPGVRKFGDIREIGAHELDPVDLVCGGFPCQPVSCAGRRKGAEDKRWLWPEFHTIICRLEPRWVLAENVPGLLSANNGRLFGGILKDLAASRYDATWQVLSAAAFGAPHLRRRLFLVAYSHCKLLWQQPGRCRGQSGQGPALPGDDGKTGVIADPQSIGCQWSGSAWGGWPGSQNGYSPTNTMRQGLAEWQEKGFFGSLPAIERLEWGNPPAAVHRVDDGIPRRLDPDRRKRIRALGNAVVPQVAEWIGRQILAAEALWMNYDLEARA